jgi:dihydrodipicolinate synthase/N-acetylneuraminate lyase
MITGVWTALPNLFNVLTNEQLVGVLDSLFNEGIDGLFLLGTTGQGTDYSLSQRMEILESVLQHVPDAKRVVVAASANAAQDARNLITHAMDHGVRGVALTPPYYSSFSEQEIQSWAAEVFSGIDKKAGIYLYNIPGATRSTWSLDSVTFVHDLIGVDGIKDSSGEPKQLLDYIAWSKSHHATVLAGDEHLTVYNYLMGGHGIVSGLSSAYPKLLVDLAAQSSKRAWEQTVPLQNDVYQHLALLRGQSPRETVQTLIRWMRENKILAES